MSKAKTKHEIEELRKKIISETEYLGSEVVYKNEFYFVSHTKSRFKNYLKNSYTISKNSQGGAFIIAERDEKLLLILQFRSNSRHISYEFPAGSTFENEDASIAAIRELQEETGFVCKKISKIGEYDAVPGISNINHVVFLAENLEQKEKSHEESEVILDQGFFTLDEIDEMISDGRITDGPTITCLYYYILHKRNHA